MWNKASSWMPYQAKGKKANTVQRFTSFLQQETKTRCVLILHKEKDRTKRWCQRKSLFRDHRQQFGSEGSVPTVMLMTTHVFQKAQWDRWEGKWPEPLHQHLLQGSCLIHHRRFLNFWSTQRTRLMFLTLVTLQAAFNKQNDLFGWKILWKHIWLMSLQQMKNQSTIMQKSFWECICINITDVWKMCSEGGWVSVWRRIRLQLLMPWYV